MTDIYVKSSGSNTSPYDTWAKASNNIATAILAGAEGDHVYVDYQYVETITADTVLDFFTGLTNQPMRLISVDPTGSPEPPLASDMLAGAKMNITGANTDLIVRGSCYIYGMIFEATAELQNKDIKIQGATSSSGSVFQVFDNCEIKNLATGAGAEVDIGYRDNANFKHVVVLRDTDIHLTQNAIIMTSCEVYWLGGTVGRMPTANTLIAVRDNNGRGGYLEVRNVDCSVVTTGDTLFDCTKRDQWNVLATNCRVGSGAALLSVSALESFWSNAKFYNVNNNDSTMVQFLEKNGFGSAESETSIYLDASDGTTNYSAKVITTDRVHEATIPYRFQIGVAWVDGTGDKTVTVEIARDGTSTALQDDEIWIEAEWADSTAAIGNTANNRAATVMTTPANQASSTAAWTGLGGTNSKQKLEVTITDRRPGPVTVWLYVAKPTTTVYVDPKIGVS